MTYSLPVSVEVCATEYAIRADYRAVLNICAALSDPDLTPQERGLAALYMFYPEFEEMPPEHYQEAIEKCYWFINCNEPENPRKAPKLMDWEQDFHLIVAPINRVVGSEIRSIEYMHWWTFISFYYEIGDCLFANVVRIRGMKAKGKKLDKSDQEFYRNNRHLVDMKHNYSQAENEMFSQWGVR